MSPGQLFGIDAIDTIDRSALQRPQGWLILIHPDFLWSTPLARLDDFLSGYFNSGVLAKQGLPSVTHIAETLNISPGYLSSLLKSLTGQSTQQHLHSKLIDLAKKKLSTTNLSVSEIAYELGFEHLQSFSKLFKNKTNLSPLEFRQTFN